MKKKIALLLAVVLAVAMFGLVLVACNKGLSDESIQALYTEMSRYHRNDKTNTEENFSLIGHITTLTDDGEVDAYVRWTSSSDKVVIASEMSSNGFYQVTIPDRTTLTEDLSYTLTGTLVDADGKEYKDAEGKPYTVELQRIVPKYSSELDFVDTLTTGNYKILMRDETNNKIWYAKGEIYGGYFISITEDKAEADVFTITVDNGSYTIQVNGKYLEVYKSGTYVDMRLVSTPSTSDDLLTLTWDTQHKTFYVDLDGTTYFLGVNYKNDTTELYREAIGASKIDFIDNGKNFPIHFVATTEQGGGGSVDEGSKYGIKQVTEPKTDTDYYLGMYNTQVSTWYFFTGVMGGFNNYYYATSDNKDDAAVVVLEAHDGGGYYIKVKSSGQYLTLGPRDGDASKSSLSITDTATTVWTYDETTKCFTTELVDSSQKTYKFYLGNHGANVDLSGLARFDADNYPALLGEIVAASEATTPDPGQGGDVDPEHGAKCESACPICGKCKNADCTEDVCKDKCTTDHKATTTVDTGDAPVVATFDFGDKGEAAHFDGAGITDGESETFTSGSYTLTIENCSKIYKDARDKMGNSCLKLGTSKLTASLTFKVGNDVNYVKIYIAKYKTYSTVIVINGIRYDLTKDSDKGEYDAIAVDTTTNKTVTLSTIDVDEPTSTGFDGRAMLDKIEFYGASGGTTPGGTTPGGTTPGGSQGSTEPGGTTPGGSTTPGTEKPTAEQKTIEELQTAPEAGKQIYIVEGIWSPTGDADDEYGNGYLYDPATGKYIQIYGMADSEEAFTWSSDDGKYSFTNPKKFQELKTKFKAGDKIKLGVSYDIGANYSNKQWASYFVEKVEDGSNIKYDATVTCTPAENGTATLSKTTGIVYGEMVTINIQAKAGYIVSSIIVNGQLAFRQADGSYKFSANAGPQKVEVTFKAAPEELAEGVIYKLDTTLAENVISYASAYADTHTMMVNEVTWQGKGNFNINPWRIGGKNLDGVDRSLATISPIFGEVKKVIFEIGDITATVNSAKLEVYSSDPTAAGAAPIATKTLSVVKNQTIEVTPESGTWKDCFYKLTVNVTCSSSSNKYVQLKSITFASTESDGGGDVDPTPDPEPTPENHGTENAPLTVAQAIELGNGLREASNTSWGGIYADYSVWIEGYVIGSVSISKGDYQFLITDVKGNPASTITVFWAACDEHPFIGDKVKVYGVLENFYNNGVTIETAKDSSSSAGSHIVKVIERDETEHTVDIDCEGATVTADKTTIRNGEQIIVTVELKPNFKLVSVTICDVECEPNGEGKYVGVAGDSGKGVATVNVSVTLEGLVELYKLDTTLDANKGTNNQYANSGEVTVNGVTWSGQGNISMNPWRIGGKASSTTSPLEADRVVCSTTVYTGSVKAVGLEIGAADSITASVTFEVFTKLPTEEGATAVYTKTVDISANTTYSFINADGTWDNCYFKFTFHVKVTATSNKFVALNAITFSNLGA